MKLANGPYGETSQDLSELTQEKAGETTQYVSE